MQSGTLTTIILMSQFIKRLPALVEVFETEAGAFGKEIELSRFFPKSEQELDAETALAKERKEKN